MSKHVAMAEKPETRIHEHEHNHDNALGPVGTRATETEKGSSRYASSEAGIAHKAETSKAERRLVLKLGGLCDSPILSPVYSLHSARSPATPLTPRRLRHPPIRHPPLPLGLPRPG